MANDRIVQGIFKVIVDANQVIGSGVDRVSEVVRSLRNFSRLDEAEFQRVDIHQGIDSALTLLSSQLGNDIAVLKEHADLAPMYCAPGQLNQVFMHLLNNAIAAIEGPGTIAIRTRQREGLVSICISDTSRGIPTEQLQHIFDVGFRSTGERVKMGFGLATDYRIVQDHRGEIRMESEIGKGTQVTVFLPVEPSATTPSSAEDRRQLLVGCRPIRNAPN